MPVETPVTVEQGVSLEARQSLGQDVLRDRDHLGQRNSHHLLLLIVSRVLAS
jgi:hypothetical protein